MGIDPRKRPRESSKDDDDYRKKCRKRDLSTRIVENKKRYTSFTKRHNGLFKKAKDLQELIPGVQYCVLVISEAGNAFVEGSESLIHHFLAAQPQPQPDQFVAAQPQPQPQQPQPQPQPQPQQSQPQPQPQQQQPEEEEEEDDVNEWLRLVDL